MNKNSGLLIPQRVLSNAVTSFIVYATLFSLLLITDGWVRTTLWIVVAYYTYTRFYVVFRDFLSIRWTLGSDHIRYKVGLLFPETTTVRSSDILGIQVSQNIAQRLLQRWEVRVRVSAGHTATPILHCVTWVVVEQLKEKYDAPVEISADLKSDAPQLNQPPTRSGQPRDTHSHAVPPSTARTTEIPAREPSLVHLSRADYWAIGFTYGKFFLLLPLLYSLASRAFGLGAPQDLVQALSAVRSNVLLAATVCLALVCLSLAYGALVALFTFARLNVTTSVRGLRVSRGLVARIEQTARFEMIDAVELRQNVVMRLSGRYSLRIIVRGENPLETSSIVVIPVATRGRINAFLDMHLPQFRATDTITVTESGTLPSVILSLGFGSLLLALGSMPPMSDTVELWDPILATFSGVMTVIALYALLRKVEWADHTRTWMLSRGIIGRRHLHLPLQSLISAQTVQASEKVPPLAVVRFRIGGSTPAAAFGWLRQPSLVGPSQLVSTGSKN